MYLVIMEVRGGSRIFLGGGSILGLQAKKGGGPGRGPTLGSMLKSLALYHGRIIAYIMAYIRSCVCLLLGHSEVTF